jgi:hypothetical protein
MITSYTRGHKVYYNIKTGEWLYVDNNKPIKEDRSCKRCGETPTKEGYDACQGYIPGKSSVCCGHGVSKPIIKEGKC